MALVAIASLGGAGCDPHSSGLGEGASGREHTLNSQATERADAVRIRDVGAPYPLNVLPETWTEQAKVRASDETAWDRFGYSVALSGDTALIGANGDDSAGSESGAAYVFVRNASDWVEQQKLLAGDGAVGDRFGHSVALSGNTALIGADSTNDAGDDSGSAYVFIRTAAAWAEEQKLLAEGGAPYDRLGAAIALEGDTAILGASGNDDAGKSAGTAYVFVRTAATWTQQQKLSSSDAASGAAFGGSVALGGDTALLGATGDDDWGNSSGAAYVFIRTATSWIEEQKLRAVGGASWDYFGVGVALSGDSALVGAFRDDDGGNDTGAAYVFVRTASTWAEQDQLLASAGAFGDRFGFKVALSSDAALIGAHGVDGPGNDSGSVYVFARTATSWAEQQKFVANDGAADDFFGSALALDGKVALVGAHGNDDANFSSGSAYLMAFGLVGGQTCANDTECASQFCVHGYCCDGACDGACERCDASSLEGTCTPTPRSSAPTSSCNGYLCDGIVGTCPSSCRDDAECASAHYCKSAVTCLAKALDGQTCAGNNACLSGHCVEGVCCAAACDEGCGSCLVSGLEGSCAPLEAGHPGAPSCAPYTCGGSDTSCPDSCGVHRDCASGYHCAAGGCLPNDPLGAACSDGDTCSSSHCADGVCCVAGDCGAYRCGAAGACESACSSTAQCAPGHECNSAGQCQPLAESGGAATESGACHLAAAPSPPRTPFPRLGALALLACLGMACRRRRETPSL